MGQVDNAMETLTAQWYNSLVTGLGLDPQQFQLYQGTNSMASNSQTMWNIFNAVPPTSINNYYDPAQLNQMSSDYNLILEALKASDDSDFKKCMGDEYNNWQEYFIDHLPDELTAVSVSKVFKKWSIVFAPSKSSCVSALTKSFINPIALAIIMFEKANGKYAWNQTGAALKTALKKGAYKNFTMESKTASSDVSHTWSKGKRRVFFGIFNKDTSSDKLSQKIASSELSINATFNKMTTFAAGPLAQAVRDDKELKAFNPWYNSATLSLAYQTKGDKVWNPEKPTTWEKAFGSDGFLQRIASAIVVADGVTITMSSKSSFSTDEQSKIKNSSSGGCWPFYRGSGESGSETKVTFDDDGKFTITTIIAAGNPQILGILQSPLKNIF